MILISDVGGSRELAVWKPEFVAGGNRELAFWKPEFVAVVVEGNRELAFWKPVVVGRAVVVMVVVESFFSVSWRSCFWEHLDISPHLKVRVNGLGEDTFSFGWKIS